MSAASLRAALAAIALAACGAREVAAQVTRYDGPGKIAEVRELNAAGDEIQAQKQDLSADPVFWLVIGLGDHTTAFGESANAQAWVDDTGTFWGSVNADNGMLPYVDWGNGEANTTLAYAMHKPKDGPATVSLHFTGGKLWLIDGGGGTTPLETAILVEVTIQVDGGDAAVDQYFATLTGRGGSAAAETFAWSQQNFDVTSANYTESGYGDNISEATLDIPAKTVDYDLQGLCEECDFTFWVELHVLARNPGGETKAYAYFRDPVHIDDAEPDLGGANLTYEGVTVLPTPEPSTAAAEITALAAACVVAQRSRRRSRGSCACVTT